MGDHLEKRFTWVLKKFSTLQDEGCYSRPVFAAGCNWHLSARPKSNNGASLGVFLELADPASLPPGWSKDVRFSLTLVTKGYRKSNLVLVGQSCFDVKNKGWGYEEFVSLTKLHAKDEGFLVNNKLIILAELLIFPAVIVPEETVKIIEPLSSKQGKSQGDSSCQVEQKTENAASKDDDGTSEEGSDDDASAEGTDDDGSSEDDVDNDDDASSPVSDDGGREKGPLNQSNALEDASRTEGNRVIKCNSAAAETEVSNDDAPKEDVDDEASSLVSNDSARNGSSVDQVKSLEDASQILEHGGRGLNNMASVTETANNLINEIQPVKETLDVNGFKVFSSQVESVSRIFKRHPDIALGFRPKNQQIRIVYMTELLSLIETLCQSPDKLSEDDLSKAEETLVDLIDVGFKLDWLKAKLNEVSEKKKMEQGSVARIQTMEEQFQKLKLMFLDLETQLHKEKTESLAARAPLSFNDVVC